MPRGKDARQHGEKPQYTSKGETPQAHVNGSNNSPISVAELLSKLDGLRRQVAGAIKRNGTGRSASGHSQKGLRYAIRKTSAEISRRGGDPRQHKDSQSTSPQVGEQESASVAVESPHASRDSGQRAGIEVAQPLSAEALREDAPRTLDYERDPRRIKAFLRYMQSERIRAVYIDGELLEVCGIFPGINVLYCTGPYGLIPISDDKWVESIVSLDPPSTTDTPERKNSLQRGASEDECEGFFGQLEAGDAVIAINEHGRETPFNFSFVEYGSSSPAVYGRDARNVTHVFYTATSGFMIERKSGAASVTSRDGGSAESRPQPARDVPKSPTTLRMDATSEERRAFFAGIHEGDVIQVWNNQSGKGWEDVRFRALNNYGTYPNVTTSDGDRLYYLDHCLFRTKQ